MPGKVKAVLSGFGRARPTLVTRAWANAVKRLDFLWVCP